VRRCDDTSTPGRFCVRLRDVPLDAADRFILAPGTGAALEVELTPTVAGIRERGRFVLRPCSNPVCELPIELDGLGVR